MLSEIERAKVIERVKQSLPDVPLIVNGRRYTGHVRGRLNRFATVWADTPSGQVSYEVSWPTLAHVIHYGIALKA